MPDPLSGMVEKPSPELSPVEESSVEADRKTLEQLPETENTFLEEEAPTTPIKKQNAAPAAPVAIQPVTKDSATLDVEKILEEGLGHLYISLPESAKPKFRQKGELAAREISSMVRTVKLKFHRALELIRDWLLTIPKVNRFFLEQEAKIKVDKIVELIEERKSETGKQP